MDHRTPSRRFVGLAALIVTLLAASLSMPTALADTLFPPGTGSIGVSVTVNGTTYDYTPIGTFPNFTGPTISGLSDGDELTVAVTGSPSGSNFSRLRVRQCAFDRPVNNNTEFNPQIFNRCSSATLGDGSTNAFVDGGPLAPGTTEDSVTFRVGVGTAPDVISQFDGELYPGFPCGPGNPCKLVVNAEVTSGVGSSNYLSFPIEFGSANEPPTVDAGPPVSGNVGASLALNGTVSDPDGDPLSTSWTVTGPCTIANPAAVDTTVTCTAPGSYTATLTADDGTNPPVSDTTTVTVSPAPNDPPSVDAGPAVSGLVGAPLALNGTVSDPDGDPLSTSWTVTGPCTIANPAAVDTTVTCTAPGSYTATLTANDGTNPPASDTTNVTVAPPPNQPPAVDAGPPATGLVGQALTLNGTVSDPDSEVVALNWTVTGPCTIANPTFVDTTVTCTAPGTYTATLTADDGTNPPVSDTTTVTVGSANVPPTVDAGPPVSGIVGQSLSLNGTVADPDGDPLSTSWTVTGPCTIADPAAVDTTVTCTAPGTYTATLTADDGTNPPVSDTTTVTVAPPPNDPPVVDAGPAATGNVGEPVALNGAVSDPEGDPLSTSWTVTGPCTIANPAAVDTTVTCTAPGSYTATLTADDGTNPPVSDTTTVTIAGPPVNDPPVVDAGPAASGNVGQPIALDGTVSDPDGDPLSTSWTVTGPCTIADPAAVDTAVTCTAPGTYTATLTADDGTNPPVSDTTTVTISSPGDSTRPECSLLTASSTGITVRTRDTGSGLATIVASRSRNADVVIPAFTPGTTDEVIVAATKIKLDMSATVELTVTDVAGNTTVCDPVIAKLATGETRAFENVPQAEHYFTVSEAEGVTAVAIEVNGRSEIMWRPDARTIDLGELRPEGNTIRVRVLGPEGRTATIMIWDGK